MEGKMKRQDKKVLFAAWVTAFFTVVCAVPYAEENDTWIPVIRMNQITGNWEGSTVIDSPAEESAMIPASSMGVTISLWYENDADEIEMEIKMDFSQLLSDWSASSGVSEGALWEIMGFGLRQNDVFAEFELGENVLYFSMTSPVDEIMADEDGLYINASGTKLRFGDSAPAQLSTFALSDFIMYRK
jgi:hypothetical protein